MYLDKDNENILINLTNNECYLIKINSKLNLSLGDQLLTYFKEEIKRKKSESSKNSQSFSIIPRKKTLQTGNNLPQNTQRVICPENEFNFYIQSEKNKLFNTKLSLKEYFHSTPKCDICDLTGIVNDELKSYQNKEILIDTIIYDYVLFKCYKCKVNIHKNCAYEVNSLPSVNYRDSMIINLTWICDLCKKNTTSDKKITKCQICWKSLDQLKKPHLMKKIDEEIWVHNWCNIWFNLNCKSNNENLPFAKKLNQFHLSNNSTNTCYRCNDTNTK